MDFIQENKELNLDASGIKLSGTGNIYIRSNGRIGIGTSNPDYPLTVTSSILSEEFSGHYWDSVTANNAQDDIDYASNTTKNISAHTNGWIRSSLGYILDSDRRIKKDIEQVPDNYALFQVNNIETKYYNYIDPLRKKEHKTVGFIAQEVDEFLPNAVFKINDFIPDEMRELKDITWSSEGDNVKMTVNDLTLNDNHTGKCKLMINDNSSNVLMIKHVLSDKKSFIMDKEYTNVFLIGKEINDFHSLDKNQIFALHHSAIQELSKKLDIRDEKISNLEKLNSDKDTVIKTLESRLETVESIVVTLQNK